MNQNNTEITSTRKPVHPRSLKSMLILALMCLGLQIPLLACSVPVFRYALERWPADTYRYVVFHDGPLSQSDQTLLEQLDKVQESAYGSPPLVGEVVDVQQTIPDILAPLWEQHEDGSLPTLILLPPVSDPNLQTLWKGPLNESSVQTILDSPVRREVIRRLADGQTAVWLLLQGKDPEENAKVQADLQAQLDKMPDDLLLPHQLSEDDTAYDTPMSDVDLRIEFSLIPLDLDDSKEIILTTIVREAMMDQLDQYLPAAIPVFGRGRALTVLDKASIVPDVVTEVCSFLVGPCSCQVKQMNPGVDLLMPVDWDGLITGMIGMEEIVPTLIVPSASIPAEINEPNLTADDSAAEVSLPVATSGGLKRNLAILAAIGVIVLAAGTVALRRGSAG